MLLVFSVLLSTALLNFDFGPLCYLFTILAMNINHQALVVINGNDQVNVEVGIIRQHTRSRLCTCGS